MDLSKLTSQEKVRLEKISDNIRHGYAVDMVDALYAIDYQESLKAEKKWWQFWK